VSYIEGGYPGSNEKDSQFFDEVVGTMPNGSRVVAFGNTRYKNTNCEKDKNVQALQAANTPVVTLVGKAWGMQVDVVLETTRDENLAMIRETVAYFKALGKEVMLDAEHFFDGYKDCSEYAMAALGAAVDADVDVLVLCDTNGGCLPWEISELTATVVAAFPSVRVGIHCHNDMDLAVANTISAVHAGASLVQGCVNGYGERTGNANLMSVIPSLQLKMGFECVGDDLKELTSVSRYFDEVANLQPNPSQPFTGTSAFAHKGGLHVAAVLKDPDTYQFIEPTLVGNERRMLVSELSGRHNILSKARELGFDIDSPSEGGIDWNGRARTILSQVKELENKGFTFEGADASIELFMRREMLGYRPPFELIDFNVLTGNKRVQYSSDPTEPPRNESVTTATVKIALLGPTDSSNKELCPTKVCLEVGESTSGPVDAVNIALNKALYAAYPSLSAVSLVDYKVRILDPNAATGATTRVMVEFRNMDTGESWTTGRC
jgi:2-isopropylmalate synthase